MPSHWSLPFECSHTCWQDQGVVGHIDKVLVTCTSVFSLSVFSTSCRYWFLLRINALVTVWWYIHCTIHPAGRREFLDRLSIFVITWKVSVWLSVRVVLDRLSISLNIAWMVSVWLSIRSVLEKLLICCFTATCAAWYWACGCKICGISNKSYVSPMIHKYGYALFTVTTLNACRP